MDPKAIAKLAFPDYRGRKIAVNPQTRPLDVTSYWSEGSRDYYVAVNLHTNATLPVPQNGTPFDGGPIRKEGVVIPEGFAIVEHSIFCGRDVGITIHIAGALALEVAS